LACLTKVGFGNIAGAGEATDLPPRFCVLAFCVDKRHWLRNLFEQDDGRRVGADQVDRLRLILSALDQAGEVRDMNQPVSIAPIEGQP
jgi:hypothetical protein